VNLPAAFAATAQGGEERGWIKVNGEIYTTTPEGARAFATEAREKRDLAKTVKEVVKARKRRPAASMRGG
jgi:hypothetical protein